MALETKFTAVNAMCTISTANGNYDGSGSLGTLLTGGTIGTLVKSIIIKAQDNTSLGMIRLFVVIGDYTSLLYEVMIPQITRSGRDLSFQNVIPLNYVLQNGAILKVATEKAEVFNVIAEGLDWSYPSSYIDPAAEYEAATGIGLLTTGNPNTDGSGDMENLITAGSSNGLEVNSIIIKAQQSTEVGMIRFFISDSDGPKYLFHEVCVPAVEASANSTSFGAQVFTQGSLAIQNGYKIHASTENEENFSVTVQGSNWSYPLG